MRKSKRWPRSKSFRLFIIAQFIGAGLLAGHLYLSQKLDQERAESSAQFQRDYLASIRNSIDLGKSLNSYSDIIYEELRNPRGRDVKLFAEKAKASSELVFNSAIISQSKRKDLENSFGLVMEKGDAVLKRIKSGGLTVAREVFEKDFTDRVKAFHLALDSHKKHAQHQASRFFSTKILGAQEGPDVLNMAAYFVLGASFLSLIGLGVSHKNCLAKAQERLEMKGKEGFELSERLYEKAQMIDEMRKLCEMALSAPPKTSLPRFSLSKAPGIQKALHLNEKLLADLETAFANLAKEHASNQKTLESISESVKLGLSHLEMLNNFKRNIINLQIRSKGDFAGSEEFLGGLHNLEQILQKLSRLQSEFKETSLESAKSSLKEKSAEVSVALASSEKGLGDFTKGQMERFSSALAEMEAISSAYREWALAKNEALTQALIISDPEDHQEEEEGLKAA